MSGLWCSVCSVQKTETVEGRVYRHSYHYINYELFVHVVKYKLDQMRKKIGAEERQVRVDVVVEDACIHC